MAAWGGRATASWAGIGATTEPLLGPAGRKRQEDGEAPLLSFNPRVPQQADPCVGPGGWIDGWTNGQTDAWVALWEGSP